MPINAQPILELVGRTPLVELCTFSTKKAVRLFAKLEGQNPSGSVKDRAALWMIERAEKKGWLKPGMKLIEATSGNTGIALAMMAKLKGFEIELVMPANASLERVLTMEAYGAKVSLTPAEKSMEGAIDYARQKVAGGTHIMLDQFSNPDNALAHYESTGPEIWKDTEGSVTHFVSSMGTTGTIMGVSKFLKEKNPSVRIIGARPTEGSNIPGIRRWPEAYLPKIFERERVDETIDVSQEEATHTTRRLAADEGIFSGMSSGGAVFCALKAAEKLESGIIVVIICDRGERYLSTDLFNSSLKKE